ncbi:MAG: RagB/SusD family nutrient uptake outer membrane protein [Bacteroidales bacterium]
MNKIYKYLVSGLSVLILFSSCEKLFDDFLDEPQIEGQTTINDYWVAVSEMDKLINGAYAVILGFSGNGFGSSIHLLAAELGDFISPYEPNYSQLIAIDNYKNYARQNNITNWSDHTRVLQYASNGENIANALIEKLGSGDYDNDPNFESLGKVILGEAYAMRAMINLEYTRFFGKQYHSSTLNTKAWLYRKTYIQSVQDAYKSRETVEDSYRFMLEDCNRAIELLPLEYDPTIHPVTYATNRFHKDFAIALKAEIYFQMNDFENCRQTINELLGGTPGNPERYPLEQYDPETPDEGFPADIYYRYENEWFGPSKQQEVIFSFASDAGTSPTRADKNKRWALFVPPEADMAQSRADFQVNGSRGIYRMSEYFKNYVEFDEANDLRFRELIDVIISSDDGNTYWWPIKFQKVSNSPNGPNILWFRSAQFLLMRAECNARLGNSGDAIADLNAVRNRAGLSNYSGSSDDSGNLIQDIIKERAREMFLERYRIWDLLRLGAIDGTLIGQGDRLIIPSSNPGFDAQHTGTNPIPWDSDIWPFAIPTNESVYNPDVLN